MSSLSRLSTLGHASTRGYATAAARAVSLPGSRSKAAAVSVYVKAGPRYESAPGAAHVLRNALLKDNSKRTGLRLVREVELLGGVLTSELRREEIVLRAEFSAEYAPIVTEILGDALSSPLLHKHEYTELVVPQVAAEYEAFVSDAKASALDALHAVAFRRGLGNSLLASPSNVVDHETLVAYAQSQLAPSQFTIVGSNVDDALLSEASERFFVGTSGASPASSTPSKYFGGDVRLPGGAHSSTDVFAIAFEAGQLSGSPDLIVLRNILGGESSVKYAPGQSVLSQLSKPDATATAFNFSYSDAGLLGLLVSGSASSISSVASEAYKALKTIAGGSVSKDQLTSAVAKAKFALLSAAETRDGAADQVASGIELQSVLSALDGVTAKSVTDAAATLLKSKPSTVALGNTHVLPYADEVL